MQIEFYGANCIRIKTKQASLVFDDNLADIGQKSISTDDDVLAVTNTNLMKIPAKHKLVLDSPGEYELGDIMLTGISAQGYLDEKGVEKATIYKGIVGDLRFVMLGHIQPDLTDEQLEVIGIVDIVFLPVGGNGYTTDAVGATKLIKSLDAKLVIPTHYDAKGINYEVPQGSAEELIKNLGVEVRKVDSKSFKLKRSDIPEKLELVVIS